MVVRAFTIINSCYSIIGEHHRFFFMITTSAKLHSDTIMGTSFNSHYRTKEAGRESDAILVMFLILKFLAFVVHKALLLNWESCLPLDQPSKTGARVAGRFKYQRLPFFCFYCVKTGKILKLRGILENNHYSITIKVDQVGCLLEDQQLVTHPPRDMPSSSAVLHLLIPVSNY
jgi:hypothetical protein